MLVATRLIGVSTGDGSIRFRCTTGAQGTPLQGRLDFDEALASQLRFTIDSGSRALSPLR
jgi:hypothetical protein